MCSVFEVSKNHFTHVVEYTIVGYKGMWKGSMGFHGE